jgi:tRNA (cmo5U34)-methyltransferase
MLPQPTQTMTSTAKDSLFNVSAVAEDFVFNERVVEVFDDMVDRSIPFYKVVIEATAHLLDKLLRPGDTVYDLGCATGSSLLALSRLLQHRELSFIGIDNSPAMLDKARLKAELHGKQGSISFVHQDITDFDHRGAGAILINYTLQFIRPLQRQEFLCRLVDNLRPGGALLMSEKIISHQPRLNRQFIDIYHDFKKSRGYSELEIARKREALENILIPFSLAENTAMLEKAGLCGVESYFRWFNFASLVAIKGE